MNFKTAILIFFFFASVSYTTIGIKNEAILWLRADKGVKTDSKGRVYVWEDQTINKNHAIQNDQKSRPVLVKSTLYQKPAVKFDGINDILKVSLLDLHNTAKVEVLVVYKSKSLNSIIFEQSSDINSNNSGFYLIDHYINGNSGLSAALKGNAAKGCGYYNGKNKQTAFFTDCNLTDYKLVDLILDKSQIGINQIRINCNGNSLQTNGTSYYCNHSDKFKNDDFFIGGRQNKLSALLDGEIAELIVYPKVLLVEKRKKMLIYLQSKYF